jgi:hypothetical protein
MPGVREIRGFFLHVPRGCRPAFPDRRRRAATVAAAGAGGHPWQLPGGRRQRPPVACALTAGPALPLTGEPSGSRDGRTRDDPQDLTLRVGAAGQFPNLPGCGLKPAAMPAARPAPTCPWELP